MLKSWDYIDPKLAQQLSNLDRQLTELREQKQKILANNRLKKQAKQKLLRYNEECMGNVQSLLEKEKSRMVDYFDEQLNVISKTNLEEDPITKILHNRTTSSLNKTKNLDETTVQEYKIKRNLPPQPQPKPSNKSSISRNRLKRVQRRCGKLKQELTLYKQGFHEVYALYEEQVNKNRDNEQIIKLLKEKINLLSRPTINENKHDERIEQILKQQTQFQQIRKQNNELLMQRNELLKMMRIN